MITGATIRAKRIQARIAGHLLCRKVGMSRSRLSGIENQYWAVTFEELSRIELALDDLIRAKGVIEQTAAALGWPGAEVAR
jgi:transcriptional regulator with XRE-family HTH domain